MGRFALAAPFGTTVNSSIKLLGILGGIRGTEQTVCSIFAWEIQKIRAFSTRMAFALTPSAKALDSKPGESSS